MENVRDRVDRPGAVRAGEALDVEALNSWLALEHPGLAGKLTVEQFPGGYSNLTYLVTVTRSDGAALEMVLRRPPYGSTVSTAHDMAREHRVLSGLSGVFAKAPRPIFLCEDTDVLGAPFYAMERRPGLVLRGGAAAEPLPPELMRPLADALVDTLAELHALDHRAAGLADLGRPEGYVDRQVEGWVRRWEAAATAEVPAMRRVAIWLLDNRPDSSGAALVHNDFKHDNLVLSPEDPTEIVALLDWEMATIGDPLMDLGTTLAYWVEPDDPEPVRRLALGPTAWPGNPTRLEVAERYAEASGLDLSLLAFYYAFGLFKVAVILQQIFYRYRQGRTRDRRFARLDLGVEALAAAALATTATGRLTSAPGARR